MISEAMFTRILELLRQQGNHIGHKLAPRRHPLGFVRHAFRNLQGRHVCGEANVDCAFSKHTNLVLSYITAAKKTKNSLLTTFFGVSSMHRHGINIPLKKREKICWCRFSCITARYWLILTQ